MPLDTPTTKEINDNLIAQLEASLNQSIPLLPRAFLRVLAKALAAVFILLYKYGGYMFEQIWVSTAQYADTEVSGETINPLLFWGRQVGVGDPAAATQAELLVDVSVESQSRFLPSGSQLLASQTGVTYITIGDVALDAATVQATIRAVADQTGGDGSGEIGNLDPGANVSFANPLASVSRVTTVVSQVTTGADGESVEAYRQRILDRWQVPAAGWSAHGLPDLGRRARGHRERLSIQRNMPRAD